MLNKMPVVNYSNNKILVTLFKYAQATMKKIRYETL
jgi:hypothetical protein